MQAAVSAHPVWAALLGAAAFVAVLAKSFSRGSRKYAGNVGEEYDAWAKEGILEHYWGEHIHLGYYSAAERQPGFFAWGKKNFIQVRGGHQSHEMAGNHAVRVIDCGRLLHVPSDLSSLERGRAHIAPAYAGLRCTLAQPQANHLHRACRFELHAGAAQAKYDFIDEMLKWSGTRDPKSILDVGCGWGGTSRRLASLYPDTEVKAITLSGEQVRRGNELSRERCVVAARHVRSLAAARVEPSCAQALRVRPERRRACLAGV